MVNLVARRSRMTDIQLDSAEKAPEPETAGFGAKVIGRSTATVAASYRHLTWAAIVSILSALIFAGIITLQFLEQNDMKKDPSVWPAGQP